MYKVDRLLSTTNVYIDDDDDDDDDDRCEDGEGSNFQVVTSDLSKEENFSNLGCSKQYKEQFVKTSETCGANQEGELVQVRGSLIP